MTKINSQDWIQKTVGKYKIILEISRGENGVVFLAANEQTKEKVALKIFSSSKLASDVLDSIKRSAEFSHVGLVKIFDYGSLSDIDETSTELNDCFYIAMEYVGKLSSPGSTFNSQKSLISKNFLDFISNSTQYLNEKTIIDLLSQLLDILEYIHGVEGNNSFGTSFGGIFPNNILIEETDFGKFNLKIAEFGIAINSKTNPAIAAFLSSEEIQGQTLDIRSDIYSLGAIAYALITGVPPQLPVASPSQIRTDVLRDWDKLIQQTLAYEPKDRLENYQNYRKEISKINKYVTKPWIKPIVSGLFVAASIIGIIVIVYFGYKIFESNKNMFQKVAKKSVTKASTILKSSPVTENPKATSMATNLLETSNLSVEGTQVENTESGLEVDKQKTDISKPNASILSNKLPAVQVESSKPEVQSTIGLTNINPKSIEQKPKLLKYTVQKGDTLWSISQKHKLTTTKLLKINYLPANTVIKVGQVLKLVADTQPIPTTKNNKIYEVQKNDTYYSLSRKFKCDVKKLQELNKNKALQTGQKIKLP